MPDDEYLEKSPFAIRLVKSSFHAHEDGYAFVRRVRALAEPTCRIPVLALTAYAREQERALALAAGFDAHLSKPITPDELVGWVARALRARSAPDS